MTKMTSEQRMKVKTDLIKRIDTTGYGVRTSTPDKKLRFLYSTFKEEAGWNISRVGEQKAFEEYLQGLPSSVNIPFYNNEVLTYANKMSGQPIGTEREQQKVLDNYFAYIASNYLELFDKYDSRNEEGDVKKNFKSKTMNGTHTTVRAHKRVDGSVVRAHTRKAPTRKVYR